MCHAVSMISIKRARLVVRLAVCSNDLESDGFLLRISLVSSFVSFIIHNPSVRTSSESAFELDENYVQC